mgnify:CR=1 FL=1
MKRQQLHAPCLRVLEQEVLDDEPDAVELEKDVADFIAQHLYRPLKEIQLARVIQHMLELATRHRMRIPPDIFLMVKALAQLEGVARCLDPEFDIESDDVVRAMFFGLGADITLGTGVMAFDVLCNLGLSDINDVAGSENTLKNRNIQITPGYALVVGGS